MAENAAENAGTSTSSSTTTVVQEDDGRTLFARLIGVLLLIAPLLLVYPLIALWPRAQGSLLCEWQKETQGSAAGQGEIPSRAGETPAVTNGEDREEQPSSGEATSDNTPSAPEAAGAEEPAGSAEESGTSAAEETAEDSDETTAAQLASELVRIQDAEKQWAPCARIRPFTGEFPLTADVRLLLLVLLAGALGAYVHAAQSYTSYIGNRKFLKQWTWWYILRLPVGAALALFVYFTARGGLLTGTTPPSETDDLNIFGIMAFAALSGLFSKQVIDKLAEVFSNFFKSEQDAQRKDKMEEKNNGGAATTTTTTTTTQPGGTGGTTTTTTPTGGTGGATGATGTAAGTSDSGG